MRVLLDTHTFLWWIDNGPNLSAQAHLMISDGANELFLSTASSWEIAIKTRLGKLCLPENLEQFVTEQLVVNNITSLPIQLYHSLAIYRLPLLHRDPFDRMLVVQSQIEEMLILTADPLILQYGARTLW
jgi:PIN domain nuclease of toxin-antitoxin system